MYAIILSGGKQYRVQAGDRLRVEKLQQELGTEIDLTDVLLIGGDKTYVGKPVVENAKVTAVVTQQARAPKVLILKKKRRQGYRRFKGHRQSFTELFIKRITTPEGTVSETEAEAKVGNREPKQPEKGASRKKSETAQKAVKKAAKKKATTKKASAKKKTTKKAAAKKTTKKAAKKATKKS